MTAEVVILGDESMYHIIEGDTVISYSKPQVGGEYLPENYSLPEGTLVSSGYISLQSETHPIEFRKVALMELDSTEK